MINIKLFLTNSSNNLLEVPLDIRNLVFMEDVSVSFLEDRYYLSNREETIFNHILKTNTANIELQKLKIQYLNSTLLYGESGTGKTTFGRYVAYKMGVPFVYLNFSSLIDSLLGGTSRNLHKVFDFVRNNKCVLMLDEIDAISIRRSNADTGASSEISRTTITLM